MKIHREQLKALIKECLVEILQDGLGQSGGPGQRVLSPGVSEQRARQPRPQRPGFDPRLDTPVATGRSPSVALKEAVKREAGGNPIMEAIFADTARTTLPNMLQHGDAGTPSSGGHLSQQEQFHGTPEQTFGEDNVERWANLAFMDAPGKKSA